MDGENGFGVGGEVRLEPGSDWVWTLLAAEEQITRDMR